ncbi:unnamed protein product [Acanthocheilonema viteae]|uniref:Proteasome subunit beta n=1 Tax=Acanthocheilonema viteae TaxID=6277 RepID=A0A498S5L6_ACAVI|nr:unnamed protein product [Acanthocheilonema viteae]
MSGTHFLIGIRTDKYVILASDRSCFAHGAIVVTDDEEKKFTLGDKLVMICIGEDGDVAQFGDWCKRNVQLYKLRYGYEMSPRASHHWIRRSIAEALRTQDYYAVDTLIGGYDSTENKAFLGSVDYLGNDIADQTKHIGMVSLYVTNVLFDHKDMTEAEGIDLLNKCLYESKRRFIVNLPSFGVMVIDKNGMRQLENIKI